MKQFIDFLKSRYGSVRTLCVWALGAICVIFSIAVDFPAKVQRGMSVGLLVTEVSHLLMVAILVVNVLRLDCRRLTSRKTAGIINSCALVVLWFHVLPPVLIRILSLDFPEGEEMVFSVYSVLLYFLGFVLLFVGQVISHAANLQEEHDLTV